MKSHKYKTGRRVMNWRVGVLTLTIIYCAVMGYHSNDDLTYVREPDEMAVFMTATVVDHPEDESVETKIRKYFPKSHKTMIAVAYAESGLDHEAMNWNCYYYKGKATTTPIKWGSKSCNKEDRKLSWSIDCGVLMKNYIGIKTCPKVSVDEHLQEMAELSKKRGFQPWSAYNNKSYIKYLASN